MTSQCHDISWYMQYFWKVHIPRYIVVYGEPGLYKARQVAVLVDHALELATRMPYGPTHGVSVGGSYLRPQFPVFSRVFALDMRATCATGALTRSDGSPDTPGARSRAVVRRECHLARNTTRCVLWGAACPGGRTQPISAPPALQAPPPALPCTPTPHHGCSGLPCRPCLLALRVPASSAPD